jgi:hypothetical protein
VSESLTNSGSILDHQLRKDAPWHTASLISSAQGKALVSMRGMDEGRHKNGCNEANHF